MGHTLWRLFLVACSIWKGVTCQQKFSKEPSSILVVPGSNTTLECLVDNMGDYAECRWQKNGKPVGLFPEKYSLHTPRIPGNCSLTISGVDYELDDGEWQCQVTSSNISYQDALASSPAVLTVQVPPTSISILPTNNSIKDNETFTVTEDKMETVTCLTRHSNPPPTISWIFGETTLQASNQTNILEEESNKWTSNATLEHIFQKADIGKKLTCVVKHMAYPTGQEAMHTILDILYKPSIHIARVATPTLEEGSGSVSLTCIAESNPPATVAWRKMGEDKQLQEEAVLEFNPVRRGDTGTYVCQAENTVGRSEEEKSVVDVLYGPEIVITDPADVVKVMVDNHTTLTCSAEGNPVVSYTWLQQLPSGQVQKRSHTAYLAIEDVSYEDQGEYTCMADNSIGEPIQSKAVRLEVQGKPQVVKDGGEVLGIHGRDVSLEGEFCSDPMPVRSTWEWEGIVLPAGSEVDGRYKAELEPHPNKKDCYISRLTVRRVAIEDGRKYLLNVENVHGSDKAHVVLNIKDPISMASVISVILVLLIVFLILVFSLLLAYNKQKFCFKEQHTSKASTPDHQPYTQGSSKVSLISETTDHSRPFPPSTKV